MPIEQHAFSIHDVSAFPYVRFNQDAAQPGYATQWQQEMITLMQHGQPFVVVYDALRTEESHEDRKQRGIWLKHNKTDLGHVCKALISIEPDVERRAQLQAMAQIAVKAFGIMHLVVATADAAWAQTHRLLADAP
ncbi:hypothetical protein JCM19000A_26900 [Silvimonas sp. JCM 19000]